ncbi:MAG: hydrogenase nickel incorporation protein HypB [Egibacteraceae bacterium]
MCMTCGCSDDVDVRVTEPGAEHHHHDHGDGHAHEHGHHHHDHGDGSSEPHAVVADQPTARTLRLEQDVLAKNNLLAERNRGWLEGRGIVAMNLMSSPGAGKTTLLERTIRDLGEELSISVVEGDQETLLDAERIRSTGCRVVQINTGAGCHLDADMLARGLRTLDPPASSLVLIENVGNLVCPALFDLGERGKVVIMSVTEGEDKPLKYPHMFRAAQLLILNKVDLLPYVQFDTERCVDHARRVNSQLEVFQVSATRGDGLDAWYGWLRKQIQRI